MPNQVGPNGVTVNTYAELLADKTAAYQAAYGDDIDLTPDSPDGQIIGNEIQVVQDQQDLLLQLNATFDPDQAPGVFLDMRAAINGIQRQAGTFTLSFVTVVTTAAVTLPGLDEQINEASPTGTIYTGTDTQGNLWYLAATTVITGAGTQSLLFRAANPGAITTIPNTINQQSTIFLGVQSINNPTTYSSLGANEEPDTAFRIRRWKSVSIGGTGYVDNMEAALANVTGVTYSKVWENDSDTTDGFGTPAHAIWVIVEGGAPADIAQAIYVKRSGGGPMRGAQNYTITRLDGTPFVISWDNVEEETLYGQFHITSIDGVHAVDPDAIAAGLVETLTPGIYQEVDVGTLTALVRAIDPNCLVVPTVGDGFSAAALGPFENILLPTAPNNQFAVEAVNLSFTVV